MGLLKGVHSDELEKVTPEFVLTISKLLLAGHSYETVLCGMSMVLAQLAADVPPDVPWDEDDEYFKESMSAVMQTVKDIVRARELNPAP